MGAYSAICLDLSPGRRPGRSRSATNWPAYGSSFRLPCHRSALPLIFGPWPDSHAGTPVVSRTFSALRTASRGVEHRADGSVGVGRVHSGECVTQVDGDAVGQARGKPEHPAFSSAGGKAAFVESGDRGGPVNGGHGGDAVGDARPDVHVAVAEVVPAEPGCVADEELRC